MDEQRQINLIEPQNFDETTEKPKNKKHFWLFLVISVLAFWAGCAIVRNSTVGSWPDDPSEYDLKTLKPKHVSMYQTVKNFVFHGDKILDGQSEDRVNVLVLGIGGPGHDGPYLSDTNIILSVKPSTKEIAMISVPRDLGVKINGLIRKINSASAIGESKSAGYGGEFARQIFEENFDIDIPYYIRVDFQAFGDVINEVGGITVDVLKTFTDTEYPGPNYTYRAVTFEAGKQNLNGERALEYSRSRHGNNGEGSDFARARRQQQILSALKEKLLSFGTYTNPIRVQHIFSSLNTHINTNLNFGQIMYLANLSKDATGNIKIFVLDNSETGLLKSYMADSGAFMLAPRSNNFNDIKETINNIFKNEKTKIADHLPEDNAPIFPTGTIEIQNGTWRVGLAAKYQKKLQDAGLAVLPPGNCYKRPISETKIYKINQNVSEEILKAVQKEITGKIETTVPVWLSEEYDLVDTVESEQGLKYSKETDILIILGDDTPQ
jgi:LCP family protein required for cell wall assembly